MLLISADDVNDALSRGYVVSEIQYLDESAGWTAQTVTSSNHQKVARQWAALTTEFKKRRDGVLYAYVTHNQRPACLKIHNLPDRR